MTDFLEVLFVKKKKIGKYKKKSRLKILCLCMKKNVDPIWQDCK